MSSVTLDHRDCCSHSPARDDIATITEESILRDRTAIVTGATSGIGEATARLLAHHGAAVTVTGRRSDRLASLAAEIEAEGGRALAVTTDVTDRGAVRVMVDRTMEQYGRVDVLVNNAGVMLLSLITEGLVDEWERMLDVNVKGIFYTIAAVVPVMRRQGGGHIVNVGSVAGRRPFPAGTVYSATKFAVRALSAGLRNELSPTEGIRVTDIEPGVVDTELLDHVSDPETRTMFENRWGDRTKLRPQDVANAILYAVSQPAHVNVNEILVRPTEQEA